MAITPVNRAAQGPSAPQASVVAKATSPDPVPTRDGLSLSDKSAAQQERFRQESTLTSNANHNQMLGAAGVAGGFMGLIGGCVLCAFTPFIGVPVIGAGIAAFVFGIHWLNKAQNERDQAKLLLKQ